MDGERVVQDLLHIVPASEVSWNNERRKTCFRLIDISPV
jgi:hypothetical protein